MFQRVSNRSAAAQQATGRTSNIIASTSTTSSSASQNTATKIRVTILNLVIWATIYYAGFMTGMHSFLATNDNCSRKLSAALGVIEEPVLRVKDPETREMKRIVDTVVQTKITQGTSYLFKLRSSYQ
jgi:hypothetical protein